MDGHLEWAWNFFITFVVERLIPVFAVWRHWDEIDAWGNLLFNLKLFGIITMVTLAYLAGTRAKAAWSARRKSK